MTPLTDFLRCNDRHPHTGKQCTLATGHEGWHHPEGHTPSELESISIAMAKDTAALLEKWISEQWPPEAILASLASSLIAVEDAAFEGRPGQFSLAALLHCIPGSDMPSAMPSKDELLMVFARVIGIRVGAVINTRTEAECKAAANAARKVNQS